MNLVNIFHINLTLSSFAVTDSRAMAVKYLQRQMMAVRLSNIVRHPESNQTPFLIKNKS